MKQKCLLKFCVLVLMFLTSQVWSASSPVVLLKKVSDRMIAQLERNKSRLAQQKVVDRIIRTTLLPYVDIDRMSELVIGSRWRMASSLQKSQFKKEFTHMVISTYAAAVASYDGDRILFYPLRALPLGNTVQVHSVIVRRGGRRIPISYTLERYQKTWRVYDFSVENVSFVQSYRSQFSEALASSGMQGLIQRLQRHNRVH